MVSFGAPAAAAFLAKPKPKPLTDEEAAKKAVEEDRKKRVEVLVSYQEKVDAIQALETELALSRSAAAAASPAVFGSGAGVFSPQLGLGAGGLAALLREGSAGELEVAQMKLRNWLAQVGGQGMSNERREYVQQYRRLEEHMRQIMDENALLAEQNARLEQTIRQTQPRHSFAPAQPYPYPYPPPPVQPYGYPAPAPAPYGYYPAPPTAAGYPYPAPPPAAGYPYPGATAAAGPYGPAYPGGGFDYNEDGADPLWAAEQERLRRAGAAGGGAGGMMSPGFRRAREADRMFGLGGGLGF